MPEKAAMSSYKPKFTNMFMSVDHVYVSGQVGFGPPQRSQPEKNILRDRMV